MTVRRPAHGLCDNEGTSGWPAEESCVAGTVVGYFENLSLGSHNLPPLAVFSS